MTLTSAYSAYYTGPVDDNSGEYYYGYIGLSNFAQGTSSLKKTNSDFSCEGLLFMTQIQYENGKKPVPGPPYSRAKCNDGRIIILKWADKDTVAGVDQYDNVYKFSQVKGKEYRKYRKINKKYEKNKKRQTN